MVDAMPAVRWVKYYYPDRLHWYFLEADETSLVLRQIELRGTDRVPVKATALDDETNRFGFITDQPLTDSEDDGVPVIDISSEEFESVWAHARAQIERHGIPTPALGAQFREVVERLAAKPEEQAAYVAHTAEASLNVLTAGLDEIVTSDIAAMDLNLRLRVMRLKQQLADMRSTADLWTVSALRTPPWTKVRELAAAVLAIAT